MCQKCFWAYPENYEHIAGKEAQVLTLVFTGNELKDYKVFHQLYKTTEGMQREIRLLIHQHIHKLPPPKA